MNDLPNENHCNRAANVSDSCGHLRTCGTALLGLCVVLAAGCNRNASKVAPAANNAPMSLKMLDGVAARQVHIQVGGKDVEATVFPKDLGQSALFLCSYTLPEPVEDKKSSEAAIDAEIERCASNAGAEILSRKSFPIAEHPTVEVIAKSPKKPSHSIRCRVICTAKEIHSLTTVTPNN